MQDQDEQIPEAAPGSFRLLWDTVFPNALPHPAMQEIQVTPVLGGVWHMLTQAERGNLLNEANQELGRNRQLNEYDLILIVTGRRERNNRVAIVDRAEAARNILARIREAEVS